MQQPIYSMAWQTLAEDLVTALDLQKHLVSDLCVQGVQMVLTLKTTFVLFDHQWLMC
jgi:hypothetical protein